MLTKEEIKDNWETVKERRARAAERAGRKPEDVLILPVTKAHPIEIIEAAQDIGIDLFGENYAQELRDKRKALLDIGIDPRWHFIGHLQRNKVKYLIDYVELIHSVDSIRLAKEISKRAAKAERKIDVLLQANCSGEDSKFGVAPEEIYELAEKAREFDNINIKGLMTLGSFSRDESVYREEFRLLRNIYEKLQKEQPDLELTTLSMGMTHDFEAAIEEGATIVRIGTAIFGPREY